MEGTHVRSAGSRNAQQMALVAPWRRSRSSANDRTSQTPKAVVDRAPGSAPPKAGANLTLVEVVESEALEALSRYSSAVAALGMASSPHPSSATRTAALRPLRHWRVIDNRDRSAASPASAPQAGVEDHRQRADARAVIGYSARQGQRSAGNRTILPTCTSVSGLLSITSDGVVALRFDVTSLSIRSASRRQT